MSNASPRLTWLEPGESFPPLTQAWGVDSPAPGLLCAGSHLSADTLATAYAQGIFPWYSEGQPTLWWSPDPRMVLQVDDFRLHPSLKKTLKKFSHSALCEIRFDHAFGAVIQACSGSDRQGQAGTWILPEMVTAYTQFHQAGYAHSVETWINGALVGGLYCINTGHAVFGESMFHHTTDASKIALAALVAFCRAHHLPWIDCQQNTRHLASLGAREMPRDRFAAQLESLCLQPAPVWQFEPAMWQQLSQ